MVLHVLGELEIIFFLWGILQMEFSRKRSSYLRAAVFFMSAELFYQFCPSESVGFFVGRIFGYLLGVCALFTGKCLKKLVRYWFACFYISIFYIPFDIISRLSGWEKSYVFVSISTCVMIFMLGLWIKRKSEWTAWIISIPDGYYVLGFVCTFCDAGIRAFTEDMRVLWNPKEQIFVEVLQFLVSVFLYTLGIAVAFTNLWRKQYKEECLLKDEYLRMSREHYEELAKHMREVRSIRYDLAAHMHVLEAYIEKEEWEKARNYLRQMKERQSRQCGMRIDIGNELVNAVIADQLGKYKDKVSIVCEGALPKELVVTDYDLCTIFSNLLSNAADACQRLQTEEQTIFMQIKAFQENLVIVIENPIEWEVETRQLGREAFGLEERRHGYGLLNIRKAVDAYGGELEFCAEEGRFQVRILLYNVIKVS